MRKNYLLKILKAASPEANEKNKDWCSMGPAIISSIESGEALGGTKIKQMIDKINGKLEEGPSKQERDELIKELKSMSKEELKEIGEIISSGNITEPNPIIKEESLKKLNFNDVLYKTAQLYGGDDFARDVVLSWAEYSSHNIIKISSHNKSDFYYDLNNFRSFIYDKEFGSYVNKRKNIIKEATIVESPKSLFSGIFSDLSAFTKRPFVAMTRLIAVIGLIWDIINIATETYYLILAFKDILTSYKDILIFDSAEFSIEDITEAFKTIFDSDFLIEKAKKLENEPEKMLRFVDFVKITSQVRRSLIRILGGTINALTILISVASVFTSPVGMIFGLMIDAALSIGIYAFQENAVVSYSGAGLSIVLDEIRKMTREQIKINCEDTESVLDKPKDLESDEKSFQETVESIFSKNKENVPADNVPSPVTSDDGYLRLKER